MSETLFRALQPIVISVFLLFSHASIGKAGEAIANGDFEGGQAACGDNDTCPTGWSLLETRPEEGSTAVNVADNGPSESGVTAWDFDRPSGGSSGDHTAVEQSLDIPVGAGVDYNLALDVKVISHDLEAGGWSTPAFEWPAFVRVTYIDTSDTARQWWYGWYLNPPGDGPRVNDPGYPLHTFTADQQVPASTWVANSFNLADELIAAKTITGIRVGGSGWSYHSRIDNVSLQAHAAAKAVPAISTWGLLAMSMLLVIAGGVGLRAKEFYTSSASRGCR